MGVASISQGYAEPVHFPPRGSQILAAQYDDAGRGVHHVTVGAAAKGQVNSVLKPAEVGEGVVLTVPEGSPHPGNSHRREFG